MWTPKQQEIATMLREGKPQKEIMAAGHGKAAISKVRAALRAEERVKEIKETKEPKEPGSSTETKLKPSKRLRLVHSLLSRRTGE